MGPPTHPNQPNGVKNMSNLAVANEIIRQLGGAGRLSAMTGAKNFVGSDNSVHFRIGRNSKGVNVVRITLNAMDTYDVEYGRIRKFDFKVLAKEDGIYNDMLRESFERNTGMYLSL